MDERDLRIRLAIEAEIDSIVALERSIETAPHWPRTEYARCLRDNENAPKRSLLIAEIQGQVVGFIVAKAVTIVHETTAEIESIAVGFEWQGRGVGRRLLEQMLAQLRQAGATVVRLEVRCGSLAAIHLYKSAGFTVEATRPGYYLRPVEDALCMRRELSGSGRI